jgi:hypothetical protein
MKKLYSGNPMIHIRGHSIDYISLCGDSVLQGQMLAGSPPTATCKKCLDKYNSWQQAIIEKNIIPLRFDEKMIVWANFGEGHYGELEWLVVAIMTLGLGIPIVLMMKFIAKTYVKVKKLD